MNGVRSYANSYLYTKIPDYERNILEYIMKAERIDKNSEAFYGVIEDVKRRQTSAVLSRVLARDDVILCVNTKPLPASFKVFACKDLKTDRSVKVFIDLSGLISLKNGFYNVNKIDILCAYLLSAMTNILYYHDTIKVLNNSSIIQAGTECFVNLSSHIFDYLRANGYSENKNKIAYIFAMYFQCTIMGLDRQSSSVKSLAAKVSGINPRDINAMEIYYDDEDLINIHTVVTSITNTFKMKGVGTDTFIEKWTWFYGVGTQFGSELFPAFSSMITDAYCGAYVNNQKTIEKCCSRAMVNFTTAIMRIGSDNIGNGYRYESSLDRDIDHSHKSVLQEDMKMSTINKTYKLKDMDFINNKAKDKYNDHNKYAPKNSRDLSSFALKYFKAACSEANKHYVNGNMNTYSSFVSKSLNFVIGDMNNKDKEDATESLISYINKYNKLISKEDYNNKEILSVVKDFKKALSILDPKNSLIKESANEEVIEEGIKDVVTDAIRHTTVDVNDLKNQWKKATNSFVKHKWIQRYLNDAQKEKIMRYYKELCRDDISYSDYKRYFKAVCKFMGIPDDKVIIEDLKIEKDKDDKDQDIIKMRYSKGSVKVQIPEGIRLIHVSPANDIKELIPSFKSKLTGRFLYPSKRVFFTVTKEIKPTKAALEKTKTTRYTPKDHIKYAYIDPTYADFKSGSVFVETLKPIPVVKYERLMEKIFSVIGGKTNESKNE